MTAIQSKGHIEIDGYLFMLARRPRAQDHIYGREEAPQFVNKFSSGDPNYRDATFYPHWVQNNWLNGFDQEKFNDGGKFYRSSSVDTTLQEKIQLERRFYGSTQIGAGVVIKTMSAWRTPATSYFGSGPDGSLVISTNTTDAPIDASATGTINSSTLNATNASFAAGQIILIHQTRGTDVGKWQKNKILSYNSGVITTELPLNITYATSGNDAAQVLVLKQYSSVTVNTTITWTAKAWDGTVGGILAFLCNGTITITGTMTAAGKGYRGGTQNGSSASGNQGEGTSGPGTVSNSANGNGGGGGVKNSQDSGNSGAGGGHASAATTGPIHNEFGQDSGPAAAGGGTAGLASLATMVFGGAGGGGGHDSSGASNTGNGGAGGGIIAAFGKTITITGAVSVNGADGGDQTTNHNGGGGGGAAGSALFKGQTVTLGTSLITAAGGTGGDGCSVQHQNQGTAGKEGRIHVDYLTSVSGSATPTVDSTQDSTLTDNPISSSFTHFVGASNGKIYSSDGASAYAEVFDTRRLAWLDTGDDADSDIGNVSSTEEKRAQGFQIAQTTKVKSISVYIRKSAAVQGLTLRIETNSAGVPSGTLVDANATATIVAADIGSSNAYVEFTFTTSFNLTASTQYWIVLQSANFGSETGKYIWRVDSSSPAYTNGTYATKSGAGAWAAVSGSDALFRVNSEATSVNTSIVSSLSGTRKLYFGIGDPDGVTSGNAKLISYDGTTFAISKVFTGDAESVVLSIAEYSSPAGTPKAFVGLGATAKIYSTTDFTTFTLSKTISTPDNPGYVFALKEYNGRLYAGGGYPEQLSGNNFQYSGFLYSYDDFSWANIGEFEHTVIKSLEVFDNLLFIGTIKKRLYVYNTASIDKLIEFPWDVMITDMEKWDDKLAVAIAPTPGKASTGNEGIYLFDRNGFHNAFLASGEVWHALDVFNNNLMAGSGNGYVYQTDFNTFQATGALQTSYFEASVPSIDKLFRDLILHHDALVTGTSIAVDYRTSEEESWTSLGTANTVGAKLTTLTFPVAFYAKKISLRLTLATTNSAVSPVFRIMDIRYVLAPDFKYLWKMRLVCADNLQWLDGSEPIARTTATISAGQTTLTLNDTSGFPTKHRGVVIDANGTEDEFAWTGKNATQLTGVTGLATHTGTSLVVKMTAAVMHKLILDLKRAKTFYTFQDIDALSYTALFHSYQAENFVVNQELGIENNVPITLLEA